MTFLLDILKILIFRSRSLRLVAARHLIVPGFFLLAVGFFAFVSVRSHMTQEAPAYLLGRPGLLEYLLESHVLQMILFLSLVYVPAVAALSNAFSGDGLGFSISRSEYADHLSVLFPLWGMIFLIGAPLVPYFIQLGYVEINLGELWLLVAMTIYTVWAIHETSLIPFAAAFGVFILSWITLPVLFVLTNYLLALPIFMALPLVYVFIQRLRELLATRTLLRGFHQHLRTLTHNPRDADAHFQLGLLHYRSGHMEAAKGYFEQSLAIDPQDPDCHYYMGRVYEAGREWAKATDEYEATYRLNAEYARGDIFREVGKGYLHTDRLDKALEFLRFFLERCSSDPEGRYWLGAALKQAGKTDEMRVQLNTVLDQARTSHRFFRCENRDWICRARTLLRSG
jgi:tetratricopeptide (TPR) repeat protein